MDVGTSKTCAYRGHRSGIIVRYDAETIAQKFERIGEAMEQHVSYGLRHSLSRPVGVEPVAEAVGHHVEAEHGEHDGEAGEDDHPGRLQHEAAPVGEHQAK